MLRRLLEVYGAPVVLSAIDLFIKMTPKEKATINYFSTSSVFTTKFAQLIKLQRIWYYKRKLSLGVYPLHLHDKIKELIDEYVDYTMAWYPTSSELERKLEIEKELKELDAEGLRSKTLEHSVIT